MPSLDLPPEDWSRVSEALASLAARLRRRWQIDPKNPARAKDAARANHLDELRQKILSLAKNSL